MKVCTIYGSSDDLIEIGGVEGAGEFNIISDDLCIASFVLGNKMRIRALYDGCWSFAVGQVDEDIELPEWPVKISQAENGYSTLLEIKVPDDVKIRREV